MDSLKINNMVLNNIDGRFKIDLYNRLVYKINIDGTIKNRLLDFNKDWDHIDYKQNNYTVNLEVTNLTSQNKITFFFTNTFL